MRGAHPSVPSKVEHAGLSKRGNRDCEEIRAEKGEIKWINNGEGKNI